MVVNIFGFYFVVDKLIFVLFEFFDFFYKIGKGMFCDMFYGFFVLMYIVIEMDEVKFIFCDYLLLIFYIFSFKFG